MYKLIGNSKVTKLNEYYQLNDLLKYFKIFWKKLLKEKPYPKPTQVDE